MRGIAIIDRQPGSVQVAIWITSRTGVRAINTNAVVIEADLDPDASEKIRSLTHRCLVLATDGTTFGSLPIEGEPLIEADVAGLLDEVRAHQARILNAIAKHKRRTRSKLLTVPTFSVLPVREDFAPKDDTATQRAFTTANFVGRAWGAWLCTDEERRRRTVHPKTGMTPWIMPANMNAPTVPDFPEGFASRLHEQRV